MNYVIAVAVFYNVDHLDEKFACIVLAKSAYFGQLRKKFSTLAVTMVVDDVLCYEVEIVFLFVGLVYLDDLRMIK